MDYREFVNSASQIINNTDKSKKVPKQYPAYYIYGTHRELFAREIARKTKRYLISVNAYDNHYLKQQFSLCSRDLVIINMDSYCLFYDRDYAYRRALNQLRFVQYNRDLPIIMVSKYAPEIVFDFNYGSTEAVKFRIDYHVVNADDEIKLPATWIW